MTSLHAGEPGNADQYAGDAEPDAERGAFILEAASALLRHRRRILGWSLGLFLVTVVGLSFRARSFTSSASFVPQSPDASSGLSGLAAQFGVGVPTTSQQNSPAFYADLLSSREVLRAVLEERYALATDTGEASETLVSLLRVTGRTPGLQLETALRRLRGMLRVDLRTRTGVISYSVQMPSARLAQMVARRLLDEVNGFNLERRQSRAGAERRFTAGRLEESSQELRAAEDRLEAFLRRNRDFANSPELTFQQQRLANDVALRRAVHDNVAQAYEKARLDEVRDTPVITVIDGPNLPAWAGGRGRVKYGLLALILGGALGLGIGLTRDSYERNQAVASDEFKEFRSLRGQMTDDLRQLARRPLGWMKRLIPGSR